MPQALPPRLVALVRLDDTTQHRVIYVPADDLLVVEQRDEDTLGAPCWRSEDDPVRDDAAVRKALIGYAQGAFFRVLFSHPAESETLASFLSLSLDPAPDAAEVASWPLWKRVAAEVWAGAVDSGPMPPWLDQARGAVPSPTALDGFRTLIAWCEAHQVADPVALNPGDEVSPHEIQLHAEDFGRLTSRPGIRVHERPPDRYVHRLAEIDGVQVRTVLDCLSHHPQTPDQEQK